MNFAERFKTHAKALTDAAKQFQSFDDMAANDDYIHSEGLNVKQQNNKKTPSRRTSDVLDSLILTTTPQSFDTQSERSFHSNTSEPHHVRRAHELCTTSSSNDSSRHGEVDEENISHDGMSTSESRPLKTKTSDLPSLQNGSTRKSASRFMDDLDERLSKPMDIEQGMSSSPESPVAVSDNRWGWMKDAAKSRLSDFMGKPGDGEEHIPFRSPLSRSNTSKPTANKDNEVIDVIQSSSILGAEDHAELNRIRLGTHSTDPLTLLLNTIKQHPQYSFIAFTVLLAFAVYFYSRHRTEDDVA